MQMPSPSPVPCSRVEQSGAAALASMAQAHGLSMTLDQVVQLTQDAGAVQDLSWVVIAARLLGFDSLPLAGGYEELPEVERPNLVVLRNAEGIQRFAVLYEINPEGVLLNDPGLGSVERRTRAQFEAEWTGDCIHVVPHPQDWAYTPRKLAELQFGNRLRNALDPTRSPARKLAFASVLLLVAGAGASAASRIGLASAIGLLAVGVAALSSFWLALFGQSCKACSRASRLAGLLPLDWMGTLFYGLVFVALLSGRAPLPWSSLLLFAAGFHGVLVTLLIREKLHCPGCWLTAASVFVASAAFLVQSEGPGVWDLLAVVAGAAALILILPISRRLAVHHARNNVRRLVETIHQLPPSGTVAVTVWKKAGCADCLYYQSILRPALLQEFGEILTLDERDSTSRWLPAPLIVVRGAQTRVFEGLPPEDEGGDRYSNLSLAVHAALGVRLVQSDPDEGLRPVANP